MHMLKMKKAFKEVLFHLLITCVLISTALDIIHVPEFSGKVLLGNSTPLFRFKLDTYQTTIGDSVMFFVDSQNVDEITCIHSKCFNINGECADRICSCSCSYNMFKLTYYTDRVCKKCTFGMEWRFQNREKGSIFKQYLSRAYDSTGFGNLESHSEILRGAYQDDIIDVSAAKDSPFRLFKTCTLIILTVAIVGFVLLPLSWIFYMYLTLLNKLSKGNVKDKEKEEKYETYTKPIVKDECEPAESRNTASSDKPALFKRPPPPSRPLRPQLDEKVQICNDDDIKQMASLYGRREENEIRFVIVGRTGSGKSATGNTIMAKADHFESKLAGGSVTRECKRGECNMAGRKIVLVDTPGLFDTQVPFEQISKEIIRCVNMSTPGPHAFLLVIQIARFMDEEIKTFNRLFDLFGDGIGKFAIITFTKLDDLEREQTTIDEYIAMAPQKLKDFIKRCQGRYLAIDNKASEKKKAAKVKNLLQLEDGIRNENRGNYYTNVMYKEAEAALKRKIKEVEEERAREKQKEIDQIQSKFTHKIDSIKKDNKKLAKEVSSNQMAQRQFQREKDKAQQETIRMKEEMKKIDKKRNEEIYLIMKKKEEEMENQARDLEQKERQHLQLLQIMQQQQAETSRRYQDMERQKELQLSKVTEDHNKRMEAEIQRIVDGSDGKYKHMMQALEAKDNGYEKLQEQMAQPNSKMQELMREKDRDFLKQQEENRKRIEQGKDRSNETLRMKLGEQKRSMDSTRDIILQEQKERDQIQRVEYQELKRQYKRTQEQMKNK